MPLEYVTANIIFVKIIIMSVARVDIASPGVIFCLDYFRCQTITVRLFRRITTIILLNLKFIKRLMELRKKKNLITVFLKVTLMNFYKIKNKKPSIFFLNF